MWTLQVTIDLPLNKARLQNRRIAEASELAAAARDRAEDTRREVVSDFEQAWAQWSAANARLTTTLGDTLPALEAVERALEARRSEEHTSELQSLMRISYAVFCLKKKNK